MVAAVRRDWIEGEPLVDEVVVIDSDGRRHGPGGGAGGRDGVRRRIFAPTWVLRRARVRRCGRPCTSSPASCSSSSTPISSSWGSISSPGCSRPCSPTNGCTSSRPSMTVPCSIPRAGGGQPAAGAHRTRRPPAAGAALAASVRRHPAAGGEAVRRSAFESLSVPMGYGVEIAALVDVSDILGADAVAQVDLGLGPPPPSARHPSGRWRFRSSRPRKPGWGGARWTALQRRSTSCN